MRTVQLIQRTFFLRYYRRGAAQPVQRPPIPVVLQMRQHKKPQGSGGGGQLGENGYVPPVQGRTGPCTGGRTDLCTSKGTRLHVLASVN